jgi:FlaA1/EpsC-like NDP-sugar epimerase
MGFHVSRYFLLAICFLDCAAIMISYIVAVLLHMGGSGDACSLCLPLLLMVIVLLRQSGHTRTMTEKGTLAAMMRRIAAPCILSGMAFLTLTYFGLPRGNFSFLLFFLLISWLLLLSRRVAVLVYVRREQKKGNFITRLLLVGTGGRGKRVAQLCEENPGWGLWIVGFLSTIKEEVGTEISSNRVIGLANDLPHILESNVVDALFFTDEADEGIETKASVQRGFLFVRDWSEYASPFDGGAHEDESL